MLSSVDFSYLPLLLHPSIPFERWFALTPTPSVTSPSFSSSSGFDSSSNPGSISGGSGSGGLADGQILLRMMFEPDIVASKAAAALAKAAEATIPATTLQAASSSSSKSTTIPPSLSPVASSLSIEPAAVVGRETRSISTSKNSSSNSYSSSSSSSSTNSNSRANSSASRRDSSPEPPVRKGSYLVNDQSSTNEATTTIEVPQSAPLAVTTEMKTPRIAASFEASAVAATTNQTPFRAPEIATTVASPNTNNNNNTSTSSAALGESSVVQSLWSFGSR
jgi:hypothetical protein